MKQLTTTVKTLSKSSIAIDSKSLIWTGSLLALSVIAPAVLAHTPQNQWITGTIVNLILFTAAFKIAPINALLVAVLPSSVALMQGLLPVPMAIILPFIIMSNLTLIAVFKLFRKIFPTQLLLGVISASFTKFALLFIVTLFFAEIINSKLIMMLQWPQFITALAGGLIFAGSLNLIPNKNNIN
ncbi:MAG: hypothetical protein PF549_00250 [Patescibacteria group bacterium]|jgi:hypothetical protein|nr:hypothetical protein [Patescibacteria group bacterium]